MSIFFTIFTPIFNRKDKIHRVFESLCSQTYTNFEWIVVDDGSTDNVIETLEFYKQAATFSVKIISQENSGKHIAWNRALAIATGDMFVPADSDDAFVPETLQAFVDSWDCISVDNKKYFSGIGVLCKDSKTGTILGDIFPTDPFITNALDLCFKYNLNGEKWGCVKTACLLERLNPEIPSTHMPESWIWFWLARKYSIYCVNMPLRIYFQDEGDNLSKKPTNEVLIRRANVNYEYLLWHLNDNIDYIIKYQKLYLTIKSFISLWRISYCLKMRTFSTYNRLDNQLAKALALITIMPGYILYYLTLRPKRSNR